MTEEFQTKARAVVERCYKQAYTNLQEKEVEIKLPYRFPSLDELRRGPRSKHVVLGRALYSYYLRNIGLDYTAIAELIGRKSHSSPINYIKSACNHERGINDSNLLYFEALKILNSIEKGHKMIVEELNSLREKNLSISKDILRLENILLEDAGVTK